MASPKNKDVSFIGEGGYGCVYKPFPDCIDGSSNNISKKNYIGKVFTEYSDVEATKENDVVNIVSKWKFPPNITVEDYLIFPYKKCKVDTQFLNKPNTNNARCGFNFTNKNATQIIYKNGGYNLNYVLNKQKITYTEFEKILLNIETGLDIIKKNNYAHCDIKLENVVYDGDKARIIDFGFLCNNMRELTEQVYYVHSPALYILKNMFNIYQRNITLDNLFDEWYMIADAMVPYIFTLINVDIYYFCNVHDAILNSVGGDYNKLDSYSKEYTESEYMKKIFFSIDDYSYGVLILTAIDKIINPQVKTLKTKAVKLIQKTLDLGNTNTVDKPHYSRSGVYHTYKKYKQSKDERNMDELCTNAGAGFSLQVQQQFTKDLIANSKNWKTLMLYHGIGSGKTCTSITMAEQWLIDNPKGRVTVILPARLKTNFLDELISPCGFEKYISADDYRIYISSSTSESDKKKIRAVFMKKIEQTYNIISFEQFQKTAQTSENLDKWTANFTKDTLVIIDEVHNLVNINYKPSHYEEMQTTKRIPQRASGIRTLIFKYFMEHINESKVILMTATPIFDNIKQFKELVSIMSRTDKKQLPTLSSAINNLRGLVSYYPGISENAYPTKTYIIEDVQATKTQIDVIEEIDDDAQNDDSKEAFMSKQRQASIAVMPNGKPFNVTKIISNLDEYAPKIKKIINSIETNIGKHLVYSNFVANGLNIVEEALKKRGWVNIQDAKQNDYKVYALWDGSLKDLQKQYTKNIVNSVSNIDGKHIRVILGSPSVKEGVSFKHIQHLHMLDPVWNNSAKIQIEGRAVRFCSHSDIPINHPKLKRNVNIHLYKLVGMPQPDFLTCDEIIYNVIIPRKIKEISIAENALKKVAIDYHLFRKIYEEDQTFESPKIKSTQSSIDVEENKNIGDSNNPRKIGNKCPKQRRPDTQGNCPPNMIFKLNKNGDECCYKVRKSKKNI